MNETEEEISQEIKELELRLLNLKHKRSRISLNPPIKLGEDNEINLITSTEYTFKITITGQSSVVGTYFATIVFDDGPEESVFLKVNENNEITEIIISNKKYYEWSDWNEAYVYTHHDSKSNIHFKKI